MLSMDKGSVTSASAGQALYYTSLVRVDYYVSPGEPPGLWIETSAAKRLDLSGIANTSDVVSVALRKAPDGSQLGQRQLMYLDGRKPVAFYDCVFSADSSVSTYWALSPRPRQKAIEKAHFKAVSEGVACLERHATARTGPQGKDRTRAQLLAVAFQHGASRAVAGEPQLHDHVLVMASVYCPSDGKWRRIDGPSLYRAKMAAGARYRAVLATELRKLGIPLEKERVGFRVASLPREVVRAVTGSRSRQIVAELERRGESGPVAARAAALRTREKKALISRSELFARAKEKAQALGFDLEAAEQAFEPKKNQNRVIRSLHGEAKERAQLIRAHNYEPKTSVSHVQRPSQRLECFIGPPASGKTAALAKRIARWSSKRHVVALSSTPLGARSLAEASGQDAMTVGSFLYRSGAGVYGADGQLHKPSQAKHHLRMLGRAALNRPTWKFGKVTLSEKSVLVVDGAHRVSSRDLERVLGAAEKARARVVLVGSDAPEQSAFAALASARHESSASQQVKRRRQESLRKAARAARQARRPEAPSLSAAAGLRSASALDALASREVRHGDLRGSVILASSRREAWELNRLAQEQRASDAIFRVARHRGGKFLEGDRVFFQRDNPALGVRAGDLGTVKRIAALPFGLRPTLVVTLDRTERVGLFTRQRRVSVSLERYGHISLGYALAPSQYDGGQLQSSRLSAGHNQAADRKQSLTTPEVSL